VKSTELKSESVRGKSPLHGAYFPALIVSLTYLALGFIITGGVLLGIVFTGGEGPPPGLVKGLLAGPAKGALTVAADSGLEAAEAAGLRPDWIIGDMDSLDDAARLDKYPSGSVIRHAADKDYTDTELALSLLREKGRDEAWLLGGGGGRVDHLFAIRSLFERERPPARWITAAEDIYCLDAGGGTGAANGRELALSLESDAPVSVFPLGDGPWKADSRGLKWPLGAVVWNRGFFGLSNVALSGAWAITVEWGRFMVILPRLPV
jgi:thiamine pyrophosphokinase